jgi:hypothetical protein
MSVLYLIHWLHVFFVIVYPWVMDPAYDMYFLVYVGVVAMHWMFFDNECLLSLLEKKRLLSSYRQGECPHIHAFMIWGVGKEQARRVMMIGKVLAYVSVLKVVLRSVKNHRVRNIAVFAISLLFLVQIWRGGRVETCETVRGPVCTQLCDMFD